MDSTQTHTDAFKSYEQLVSNVYKWSNRRLKEYVEDDLCSNPNCSTCSRGQRTRENRHKRFFDKLGLPTDQPELIPLHDTEYYWEKEHQLRKAIIHAVQVRGVKERLNWCGAGKTEWIVGLITGESSYDETPMNRSGIVRKVGYLCESRYDGSDLSYEYLNIHCKSLFYADGDRQWSSPEQCLCGCSLDAFSSCAGYCRHFICPCCRDQWEVRD